MLIAEMRLHTDALLLHVTELVARWWRHLHITPHKGSRAMCKAPPAGDHPRHMWPGYQRGECRAPSSCLDSAGSYTHLCGDQGARPPPPHSSCATSRPAGSPTNMWPATSRLDAGTSRSHVAGAACKGLKPQVASPTLSPPPPFSSCTTATGATGDPQMASPTGRPPSSRLCALTWQSTTCGWHHLRVPCINNA